MLVELIGHSQINAVQNTALLFFPLSGFSDKADGRSVVSSLYTEDGKTVSKAVISDNGRVTEKTFSAVLSGKCDEAAIVSKAVYEAGVESTGTRPAWGTLTGIRAAKFVRKKEKYMTADEIADIYCVDKSKIRLCEKVGESEERALSLLDGKSISLYISIPFCPSRCSYCSFVSHSIESAGALLPDYVRMLCRELELVKGVCERTGVRVSTVYMGGGTPTTLSAEQMDTVLCETTRLFGGALDEFTVEAGRPDTVTREKLEVLRKNGISRISINPQTMRDETLVRIGRRHTADDIVKAYAAARDVGFGCINMDIIAGLDGETPDDFSYTLDRVVDMNPENVTVHTLAVKRAARLRETADEAAMRAGVTAVMVDRSQRVLEDAGYRPYYMYKQKNMVGNLENVGYARDDKDGLYNIYIMGEYQTIAAVGAGAVSKVVGHGRIDRIFNYKYPYEYLSDADKMTTGVGKLEELIRNSL